MSPFPNDNITMLIRISFFFLVPIFFSVRHSFFWITSTKLIQNIFSSTVLTSNRDFVTNKSRITKKNKQKINYQFEWQWCQFIFVFFVYFHISSQHCKIVKIYLFFIGSTLFSRGVNVKFIKLKITITKKFIHNLVISHWNIIFFCEYMQYFCVLYMTLSTWLRIIFDCIQRIILYIIRIKNQWYPFSITYTQKKPKQFFLLNVHKLTHSAVVLSFS